MEPKQSHTRYPSKERYKIEAKNSELKNVLGYDRALSYGLSYMEMQGAITMAYRKSQENTENNGINRENIPANQKYL